MPFSAIVFIVSVLMVIGVIAIAEALIKIFIKGKNPPDTVLIKVTHDTENLDLILRDILMKYPFSNIQIDPDSLDEKTNRLLEIIKKDYPEIKINPPK